MNHIDVRVQVVRPGAVVPRYMSECAAGMDLHAALDASVSVKPGQRMLIPTGLAFAIPEGYEGQVRPRSGLALRHGVSLVNSPGTIDADYRGEVGVILINHGEESLTIQPGDRIAQMVLSKVVQGRLRQVDSLDETRRGSGGFGHTGWRDEEEIDHE